MAAEVAGVESVGEFTVDAEGDEDSARLWCLEVNGEPVLSLSTTSEEGGLSKVLPFRAPRALGGITCADIADVGYSGPSATG